MRKITQWLFKEKKWWAVLSAGLLNSLMYALFTAIALRNMAKPSSETFLPFELPMGVLFTAIVLLKLLLTSTSFEKFFISTAAYIGIFIVVGLPLSQRFYMLQFDRMYPGDLPGNGDGIGILLVFGVYLFFSLALWGAALILTAILAIALKHRKQDTDVPQA